MNPAEIISHAAFELQPFATRALKECADGFFNHPFMYCRTLTSIGYEPFPPTEGSLLGIKLLWLPNVLQNMNYIRSVDGLTGLYRGLVPSLLRRVTMTTVAMKLRNRVPKPIPEEGEIHEISTPAGAKSLPKGFRYYFKVFWWDYICQAGGLIAAHPFRVIAVRSMAQFVGREAVYDTIVGALKEIYSLDGIRGFFIGLVPVLLQSFVRLAAYYLLDFRKWGWKTSYTPFESYLFNDAANEIGSWLSYPLEVCANTLIVNDCGLLIGKPPHAPLYSGWTDIWNHLSAAGQLYRGLWNFGRTYSGPTRVTKDGSLEPDGFVFGPVHRPGGDICQGENCKNAKPSASLLRLIFFMWKPQLDEK